MRELRAAWRAVTQGDARQRPHRQTTGFVALGEVDPSTLAELDELRTMPLVGDVFDPPIRFTVK